MSGVCGLIRQGFHDHPKAKATSLAALGVWALGTEVTRAKRSSGFLSDEDALELARGDRSLLVELVVVELWDREPGGYRYHDYGDWNGDIKPKTLAAKIVHEIVPAEHPSAVRQSLQAKVAELLEDGQEARVVEAALKLWLTKPNSSAALLPHLVSDVIRQGGNGELIALLRECYKTADVSPLRRYDYVFTEPDPPIGASVEETRTFMQKAKRAWLTEIQKGLI